MDENEAAKRAAVEERRRAAKRARLLGSASSRMDSICGIPSTASTTSNTPDQLDTTQKQEQYASKTSPSDISSHLHNSGELPEPLLPIVPGPSEKLSDSPKVGASIDKTTEKHPPRSIATSGQKPSLPHVTSTSSSDKSSVKPDTPTPVAAETATLSRKMGMCIGVIFALLFALCDVYFPQYSLHAATAFWAAEILMWSRAARGTPQLSDPKMLAMANLFMPGSSNASSSSAFSLSQLGTYLKVVFYTGQDWLISQFFIIILTTFFAQQPIMAHQIL